MQRERERAELPCCLEVGGRIFGVRCGCEREGFIRSVADLGKGFKEERILEILVEGEETKSVLEFQANVISEVT